MQNKDIKLSALKELEAQYSFLYFALISVFMVLTLFFLILAEVSIRAIIIPATINFIIVLFSYLVYRKKKNGQKALFYSWVSASLFVILPFIARYNYVKIYNWEVALDSYNSCVFIIISVVTTQFLFNKRIFKVLSIFALSNWIIFLIAAYLAGAKFSLVSVIDGRSVEDFVILREIFIMVMGTLIWFAVYRIIPITEAYEKETTGQRLIIENQNIHLERKVEKRTIELFEANEKLKELDRLKSKFFANVSHEIRTPLTLILSPIESYLQGDYKDEIDEKFFNNIYRNATHLLKLINNILDLSKIEAGRTALEIKRIDILKIFHTFISTIELACNEKNISLQLSSDSDSIFLFLDPEKIEKVVMNLFSNALKFTESGGVINIQINSDADNCYIDFMDTGIGIHHNQLNSIFERFSHTEFSLDGKHSGTGIGLSIVKEFIDLHNGSIAVQSKYIDDNPDDHGTIFKIIIPKGKSHFNEKDNVILLDDNEAREAFLDYSKTLIEELSGKNTQDYDENISNESRDFYNLLIVEDNEDMRNYLSTLLKDKYKLHFAVNGSDGIKIAKIIRPDLIITDVMMPVMDGHEMTRRLKHDKTIKTTPIIMLTAKSDIVHKIEGLEYGADDFLTKPFNSKELFARIKSLIKNYEFQKIISDRNREIENDLDIARIIIKNMMPEKIREIPGLEIETTCLQMDKIGGDFYNLNHSDKSVEIFIADVSGHGLLAAFLALITKIYYESISDKKDAAHVLNQINQVVCKSTVRFNFVTAFFGSWDFDTNIFRYSSAGHFPQLLYRKKNDEFFDLYTVGKPLGWIDTASFLENKIEIKSGDRIIFFTDGITETFNPDHEMYGDARLKEFIQNNTDLNSAKFSSELKKELQDFSKSEKFQDDITLIVWDIM